ncbi:unnamed protein product [Aphis gossypii]|uniref:Uncharacterized protein n=1 Tax=Aphis gossypii TaxID=80765 RepID=A0A9P0IQ91_APHGO|nr:unnamed protein product [Aphis gossypii]
MYMCTVYTHRHICSFSLCHCFSIVLAMCLSSVSFFLPVSPPFSVYPRQNVPVRTCIPSALLCAHISRISATEIVWPHSKDTPSGVSGLAGEGRMVQCVFSVLTTYIHVAGVRSLSNAYLPAANYWCECIIYIMVYFYLVPRRFHQIRFAENAIDESTKV